MKMIACRPDRRCVSAVPRPFSPEGNVKYQALGPITVAGRGNSLQTERPPGATPGSESAPPATRAPKRRRPQRIPLMWDPKRPTWIHDQVRSLIACLCAAQHSRPRSAYSKARIEAFSSPFTEGLEETRRRTAFQDRSERSPPRGVIKMIGISRRSCLSSRCRAGPDMPAF